MKRHITIIRINPINRTFTRMRFKAGRNALNDVRRVVGAKKVGHYELTRIEDPEKDHDGLPIITPLMVAAGLDVEKDTPGFRFKGGEGTGGIAILFGKGPGGGMISCPVNTDWVEKMIVWLDGEELDEDQPDPVSPSDADAVEAALA